MRNGIAIGNPNYNASFEFPLYSYWSFALDLFTLITFLMYCIVQIFKSDINLNPYGMVYVLFDLCLQSTDCTNCKDFLNMILEYTITSNNYFQQKKTFETLMWIVRYFLMTPTTPTYLFAV